MESWKVGLYNSVVVSDVKVKNNNFPSPPNSPESEEEEVAHYGGYLIAESIGNSAYALLIAAAPDLKESLWELMNFLLDNEHKVELPLNVAYKLGAILLKAENSLKKATGE